MIYELPDIWYILIPLNQYQGWNYSNSHSFDLVHQYWSSPIIGPIYFILNHISSISDNFAALYIIEQFISRQILYN